MHSGTLRHRHQAGHYVVWNGPALTQSSVRMTLQLAPREELGRGQSSLLALLLATRFFEDPLVCLPCGISVIVMTLAGFGLVVWWRRM